MITMDDLDHSMHISDHDWLSFFEESEECCLLKASLACPDSTDLSDGEDQDFTHHTYMPLKEQQAGKESKKPEVFKEVASVVCSAEKESNIEPVNSDPKAEPENILSKDVLSCSEKERWFVTVNDNQPREPVSGALVKKKRKQKRHGKDKHRDGKDLRCGNTDIMLQSKDPKDLFSDKNKTCLESVDKGHCLQNLDEGKNRTKNVKSGSDEMNQPLFPGSVKIQELSSESHSEEPIIDLSCLGTSYKYSTFHGAIENEGKLTKKKSDIEFDKTKCSETSDAVFPKKITTDLECKHLQTTPAMDLTCTGDSHVECSLDTKSTKSTGIMLDKTKQADFKHFLEENSSQRRMEEQNVNLRCREKDKLRVSDNIRKTEFGATHRNVGTEEICSDTTEQEDLRGFGASNKEDHLSLKRKNHAEPIVDRGKSTDNHVSHTNSIESDEFADVEFFSSSSHDSDPYHSAAESMEDPLRLSMQNSPCNLHININDDSLADRGMNSCLRCERRQPHIETSQIFPSAHPGADNMPNDNSTCNESTEGTALSMSLDTPTSAGNSSSFLARECLQQFDIAMESPEAYAKATGNNQPVYAISAFWDEMEKLTINDILHIRTRKCMLPFEENTEIMSTSSDLKSPTSIVSESATLDTMDAADSDYYTNLDELKPDHSSCDFSTSDFEEEYWQFINSSCNSSPDLHNKDSQSQCMDYVTTSEEDSDEIGTPGPSEKDGPQKWSCGSSLGSYGVTVPQQMRKTKSMYDVHALRSIEDSSSQAFLNQSSSKSIKESLNMSDELEVLTPILCHANEQCQISFPKVFKYLFNDNKAKCEALSVSVYGLLGNSNLPSLPINNYTFCTTINDLPLRQYRAEPIPIFSCSRPTVRELTFLKQGGIFFGTNYTAMLDISPIRIISQSIINSMNCKQTDRAFCFSQDLSSLYSVRNICFLDKGSDLWRLERDNEEKTVDTINSRFAMVDEGGLSSTTPLIFKETTLRQISMVNNQMPSDYQGIFSTIKQSDMCLVCIAFASWVLRSSDPEAADAWKAALLANVSALSAIQYLRQYMKKKAAPQDDDE